MDFVKWHKYSFDRGSLSGEKYSLPIVVRVEKNEEYYNADAFTAAVKLIAELFGSGKWEDSLDLWMRGQVRKVVRRARGQVWENLQNNLDYLYVQHNNVEMMVFEPHLLDNIPPVLKKLQVQGIEFNNNIPSGELETGFNFAVDPLLGMSTGKSIAQVAHAAQFLLMTEQPDVLGDWFQKGCPSHYTRWESITDPTVQVVDAGFTEIPPDSLTVKGVLL